MGLIAFDVREAWLNALEPCEPRLDIPIAVAKARSDGF
jgi:hypothetical protein